MFEWIPVCAGAVLGVLHQRGALRWPAMWLCSVVCGAMATVLSGEFREAPSLIFVDIGLVLLGVCAALILQRRLGAPATRNAPPDPLD